MTDHIDPRRGARAISLTALIAWIPFITAGIILIVLIFLR